jgi:hypothetical protein
MRISRYTNSDITLDQNSYIRQILKRFRMDTSKPISTPFAAGSRLTSTIYCTFSESSLNLCSDSGDNATKARIMQPEPKLYSDSESQATKAEIKLYQAMVGSLMYTILCI